MVLPGHGMEVLEYSRDGYCLSPEASEKIVVTSHAVIAIDGTLSQPRGQPPSKQYLQGGPTGFDTGD